MNERKDIIQGLHFMIKRKEIVLSEKDRRPIYAKLAKKYNCDYRTIKKALNKLEKDPDCNDSSKKEKRSCKISPYTQLIEEKVKTGAPAIAIFHYLREQTEFDGCYTIVKNYIHSLHAERLKKAIVRFETNPGLQVQIDWKESLKFETETGERINFNVFLAILGFSRYKFLCVTETKDLKTVEYCISSAIRYFGGASKEWLFDNMKSIIDKARTIGSDPVFNDNFLMFCKDASFEPKACVSYRPCTKGKVETLARLANRLKVYSGDIKEFGDIEYQVAKLNEELNTEVCQGTGHKPIDLFQKEKEYLTQVNLNALDYYFHKPEFRKVSRESLITYQGIKYSVPVNYIGKLLEIKDKGSEILISYEGKHVAKWDKSNKLYNYKKQDYIDIIKASDLKDLEDDDIESMAERNLKIYDELQPITK